AEHPRQALQAYEQKRLPMTAEIVRSNRRGGPEGVIDAVEQLAPDGFTDSEKVLSYAQREAIVRGYASKAGFAAPSLAAVRAEVPTSTEFVVWAKAHLRHAHHLWIGRRKVEGTR